MFQRNRNSTAVNKLTFRIKFAFVKLFYTYAMRDNLSKPSTVEPLVSGHPWDRLEVSAYEGCPLTGG